MSSKEEPELKGGHPPAGNYGNYRKQFYIYMLNTLRIFFFPGVAVIRS